MAIGWRSVLICVTIVCMPGISSADSLALAGKNAVQAYLVANVANVAPGESFELGVRLHIAPPWHIYWKYPGPSGLATRINFGGPGGFVAGDLEWPIPKEFRQPGDIPGYGYEEETLLFSRVKAPAALEYGQNITLTADVRWLVCGEICVPGKAILSLELPVKGKEEPANEELFTAWRARLPKRAPSTDVPFRLRMDGAKVQLAAPRKVELITEWPSKPAFVRWVPAPGPGFVIDNPGSAVSGNVVRLSFEASALPLPESKRSLDALIIYKNEVGAEVGAEEKVELPVE